MAPQADCSGSIVAQYRIGHGTASCEYTNRNVGQLIAWLVRPYQRIWTRLRGQGQWSVGNKHLVYDRLSLCGKSKCGKGVRRRICLFSFEKQNDAPKALFSLTGLPKHNRSSPLSVA